MDYTGFTTISVQRFGQKFVGKVANPQELLLFTKAAARAAKAETGECRESLDSTMQYVRRKVGTLRSINEHASITE